MSSISPVRVVGLNELRKGLRSIDRGLPKTVRVALNSVAELFVGWVRPKVPHRSGAAAASLRAQSSQTAARVAAGGPKAPYYPWLDFGGRVGRKKANKRPFFQDGRYVYPTLVERSDDIQAASLKALAQLAANSGIEVD